MLNMVPRNNLGNTFPCGACKHPVVVFMNICLIIMSINESERGRSSSPPHVQRSLVEKWETCTIELGLFVAR